MTIGRTEAAWFKTLDAHIFFVKKEYLPNVLESTFSHSNSSKTTGQKHPLQITSDLQRVFPPSGFATCDMTNSLVLLQKLCKNCPHPEKLQTITILFFVLVFSF